MSITLDRLFAREIKTIANGDATDEYRFKLNKELKDVSTALSHRYQFLDCIKKYGRGKVCICLAATMSTQHGYDADQRIWAQSVMQLWSNRTPHSVSCALINIHPAILADNSYKLRQYTMGEVL